MLKFLLFFLVIFNSTAKVTRLEPSVATEYIDPVTKSYDEEIAFASLGQILKILDFQKGKLKKGKFRIYECDQEPKTWVKAALTSSEILKTYLFNANCDVSGTFRASFLGSFPVEFNLRNLDTFTKVKMNVLMKIRQTPRGIRYHYEVNEGTLSGAAKTILFKAEYEVDIDPLTGSAKYATEEGNVTITKIDKKLLSLTRPLLFAR